MARIRRLREAGDARYQTRPQSPYADMAREEVLEALADNKHLMVYWANPDRRAKTLVRNKVRSAVRDGSLVRLPCEVCGSSAVEAHHDDYSKPLAVRWLCPPHHREHHRQMKEAA